MWVWNSYYHVRVEGLWFFIPLTTHQLMRSGCWHLCCSVQFDWSVSVRWKGQPTSTSLGSGTEPDHGRGDKRYTTSSYTRGNCQHRRIWSFASTGYRRNYFWSWYRAVWSECTIYHYFWWSSFVSSQQIWFRQRPSFRQILRTCILEPF